MLSIGITYHFAFQFINLFVSLIVAQHGLNAKMPVEPDSNGLSIHVVTYNMVKELHNREFRSCNWLVWYKFKLWIVALH